MAITQRCIHGNWPHVCSICRKGVVELTPEMVADIEAHGAVAWWQISNRTLEALIERDKECRALRRCLEMERATKRGNRRGEVVQEEVTDTPVISNVSEEEL